MAENKFWGLYNKYFVLSRQINNVLAGFFEHPILITVDQAHLTLVFGNYYCMFLFFSYKIVSLPRT